MNKKQIFTKDSRQRKPDEKVKNTETLKDKDTEKIVKKCKEIEEKNKNKIIISID